MRVMMKSGDAMSEVGTLKELGVKEGDVVENTGAVNLYTVMDGFRLKSHQCDYVHNWEKNWDMDGHDNCGQKGPYRITFQTIDGKPDCASVKMEEVN